MTDNVVYPFGQPEPVGEPRHDIVDVLEMLRQRALRGEIVAMAITAVSTENVTARVICTPENAVNSLLGGIEITKIEIYNRVFPEGGRTVAEFD